MSFATGTSQCTTSTVGIRITEGAVWFDSLANLNSPEFSELANYLTAAVSNNNKQIFVRKYNCNKNNSCRVRYNRKSKACHSKIWGYFIGGLLKDCKNHGKLNLTVNGDAEQS